MNPYGAGHGGDISHASISGTQGVCLVYIDR